ncbi:MAG: hypothetical protein ABI651_02335 [Verrucomicrobiota bacterium]
MPSDFNESDFLDSDFRASPKASHHLSSGLAAASTSGTNRPPTSDELSAQVSETQQKLAELKRIQEELDQKRVALEEERRRQMEFHTGRQEMIHHLTRGVGLLEEAEFAARRDGEQMSKTLADLRAALAKIESIHEAIWTQENYPIELTKALTTLENARMEWNSARLKWTLLSGNSPGAKSNQGSDSGPLGSSLLTERSFGGLCKLGLALTWPLAVVALLALAVLGVILLRH